MLIRKPKKNHEFVRNAAALHDAGLAPGQGVDYEQGLLAVTDPGDTQLIGCLNERAYWPGTGKAIALLPGLGAVALGARALR